MATNVVDLTSTGTGFVGGGNQPNAGFSFQALPETISATQLVALKPPTLDKTSLEFSREVLKRSWSLPSYKPPLNVINLLKNNAINIIKNPAIWSSILKGLAAGLAGAVSDSNADLTLQKLQGQIPNYVDARSAQFGSAAIQQTVKNGGELFHRFTPDQRGRLIMGAAELSQALGDKKITQAQFKEAMGLLLQQVTTGKKANVGSASQEKTAVGNNQKIKLKKLPRDLPGSRPSGENTGILGTRPSKKFNPNQSTDGKTGSSDNKMAPTSMPMGGALIAPSVKSVVLDIVRPVKLGETPKRTKTKPTDGKQAARASAGDNSGGGTTSTKTITINGKEIHIKVGETYEVKIGNKTHYFKASPNGIQISGPNINIGNASDVMNIDINESGGVSISSSGSKSNRTINIEGNGSVNIGNGGTSGSGNSQADRDFAQAGRDFARAGRDYAKAKKDAARDARHAERDARHAARASGASSQANTNIDDMSLDEIFKKMLDKCDASGSKQARGYFEALINRIKQLKDD